MNSAVGRSRKRLRVGLIGASGYWAARLLPNLYELQDYELVAGSCHSKPLASLEERLRHPTRCERDYTALTADPRIDAVLIATPAATHYDIVRRALQAGKHVLVEKPLALCARDADRLLRLADREGLVLMVDHTYLFSPHIIEIKRLFDAGTIGRAVYHNSVRANLGLYRRDCNIVWDLGYHDLYLVRCLYRNHTLRWVSASGGAHLDRTVEDVCDFALGFDDGLYASAHVSWLAPVKVRRVFIGGTEGALEYRDDSKIVVHRRVIKMDRGRASIRDDGDAEHPMVPGGSALAAMLLHFHECVVSGQKSPIAGAEVALEVVRMAELVCQSLCSGRRICLK